MYDKAGNYVNSNSRTAGELTGPVDLRGHDYDNNIKNAATRLVTIGHSDAIYRTQWASGATLWETDERYFTITRSGRIQGALKDI